MVLKNKHEKVVISAALPL